MKNLYWRDGGVLWCSFPLPGYPKRYSLKIKTAGSAEDKRVCERTGEKILSLLKTRHIEGKLFTYAEFKQRVKAGTLFEIFDGAEGEAHKKYNPTYARLVGRYWYNHLKHTKSGGDRYHLIHSLKKFGKCYAKDIEPGDVIRWLKGMQKKGVAINTINLRLSYMQAVFNYANKKEIPKKRINYNPVSCIEKFKGANKRKYLLTPEKFELNYNYLCEKFPLYALYYLALWETGRRPLEVALYRWEMYDFESRVITIPGSITKTGYSDEIPFSDRLHNEIMQSRRDKGLIFHNKLGNPWVYRTESGETRNNNYLYMKALREHFKEDVGVARDCRRGFVTRKIDGECQSIDDVMLLSGHTTYSTIKRYRVGQLSTKRKVINSTPFEEKREGKLLPFASTG